MLGFGPIGAAPIGALLDDDWLAPAQSKATLSISATFSPEQKLLVPQRKNAEGLLIKATSALWTEIVKQLSADWSAALQISPDHWEQIVAGAFHTAGYEVTLTPRSGDLGRDVIAIKHGVGCVKVIGSVKAYKPGHLVTHDDVRALAGVVAAERDVSKGILTTTSDFAPRISEDKILAPLMPTRLELMNGEKLQQWLRSLTSVKSDAD